jgi:hypothetical protein
MEKMVTIEYKYYIYTVYIYVGECRGTFSRWDVL